jgi:hypothetical protein
MNIDRLRSLIRELIKTELEEASTTGTGTTISTGDSEAFATPFAFRGKGKKSKNRGLEQSKRLGYKPVKK